jgi:hypothetical protein
MARIAALADRNSLLALQMHVHLGRSYRGTLAALAISRTPKEIDNEDS